MKKFIIQVEEQLSRSIEIEADSEEEAIYKVRNLYKKEEIVLDAGDYVTTEFHIADVDSMK